MNDGHPALLQLSGVHTHIGQYHILHDVTLDVEEGKVTMLMGRNGAGKTTTLRTIMGLWRASRGSIRFAGRDIHACKTSRVAGEGIAYVPENTGIFGQLSVGENLLLAARKKGTWPLSDARRNWIFGLFPAVHKYWDYPAGKLSGGQRQMVAVARALVQPSRLLIVDEPSKGLDPGMVNNMIRAFSDVRREGTSILLVEQNLSFATSLGDNVAVMDNGHIAHSSSMQAFAADVGLQRSLLGLAL
ncbi:ABC transporter ATP-binding protein [Caballeronia sp. ATUFL_M1_KS5A]|uniref:ABC transporter ATP-binding protein n=1 Tax=Caballeronia sp. ATUFL_M1_KS5A TaxID=2921778 RepID=UPI0020297E73|nr:ABC transporter ATP-binding protein [Caballeronia sp. ATUFL_M1_KS5A]